MGQKNHKTFCDKKIMQNHGTSWDQKKIMQPIGTKKIHATSRDQNIPATSRDKKITQTLGTKKNHATFSGGKSRSQ